MPTSIRSLALLVLLPMTPLWAQRDLRDIPQPDPVAERAAMQVGDGFEVNLYASDPMFAKPIHMNFDDKGRLWIASSRNYPHIEPGAPPSDQVIVLEDRNRDGTADHHTVFADNLLIPTGVLPGDGGVYVANSTELIHLQDTDGDGRADKQRTILSGFGTEDTHHLLHTLRWAPDGWMHLNQSIYIHSHIETPYGIQRLDGGGIWRFDPTTSQLEIFAKGFVNPWGHAIDGFGQSFVTDGAYYEGINYTFPDSVFVFHPGATRWLAGLNPGSPKHCGLEIISGDAMPAEMQGRMVTNDFRSHRVCVFEVARQGSGYRSVQLPELIRTQHVAFRPIDVKMGPDGAIYVADWYNPIIQHGEVDFRDPRRDREHGRIWRITAKGKPALVPPRYDQLKEEALCNLLHDRALWVRQFARMELATRQRSQRDAALGQYIDKARQAEQRSMRRLESLWVKLCARQFDADVIQLIDQLRTDDQPRVRAAAMRTISGLHPQLPQAASWLAQAVSDEDDQVVLEAVTGLGQLRSAAAVEPLLTVAARPAQDQFLKFALWNAVRANETFWMKQLSEGQLDVRNDLAKLRLLADAASQPAIAQPLLDLLRSGSAAQSVAGSVVELVAEKADAVGLSDLLEWITTPSAPLSDSTRAGHLETLARVTQSRSIKPDRGEALLKAALQGLVEPATGSPDSRTAAGSGAAGRLMYVAGLVDLAGNWQCAACTPAILAWLKQSEVVADNSLVARALLALARIPDEAGREQVRQLSASGQTPAMIRAAALAALNVFDVEQAAHQTLAFLAGLTPSDLAAGEAAASALVARPASIEALRKRLQSQPGQWQADGARVLIAALRNAPGSDETLLTEVMTTTGLDALGWKWTDGWAKQIIEKAYTNGDADRGESIYRQARLQCVRCHAIGSAGGAIGPNLVSLGGSSTPEYILQSLIEPNAKLKEGFQTLAVLTDDGQVISGLQKAKTDTQLQLLLADGQLKTLSTESIESTQNGRSLMPAGLVDTLKEQELIDLTRFLIELGKSPKYTVDTQPRVRSWSMLTNTPAAVQLINRTSLDTVAASPPELVWAPITSLVSGRLPTSELPTFQLYRDLPTMAFVRFEVNLPEAGQVRLEMSASGEAVSLWVNGRPRKLPTPDEAIALGAGAHQFVLGLRVKDIAPSFGCIVR